MYSLFSGHRLLGSAVPVSNQDGEDEEEVDEMKYCKPFARGQALVRFSGLFIIGNRGSCGSPHI